MLNTWGTTATVNVFLLHTFWAHSFTNQYNSYLLFSKNQKKGQTNDERRPMLMTTY